MYKDPRQYLATGPQPQLESNQKSSNLFGTSVLASAAIASGFIPTSGRKRMWDHYINAIRTVESASPGGVLRTFKTSEFLSPLESFNTISVAPYELKHNAYGAFLKNQFGSTASRGVSFTKTGSLFGEITSAEGKLLGYGVGVSGGLQKGTSIADYYARVSGTKLEELASLNESLLKNRWLESGSTKKFKDWKQELDITIREQRLIVGESIDRNISLFGKNISLSRRNAERVAKGKVVGNLLRAKAASTAGRLNVLLSKPFEIPVIGEHLSKFPGIKNLPVTQGTASHMFGGYIKKGLIIGAAWKGLEYLDYQRSEGDIFGTAMITGAGAGIGGLAFNKPGMPFTKKNALIGAGVGLFAAIAPRFESGLFHGAATLGTDANVLRAKASDISGVTRSIKEQEEVTPGLLELSTAIGFAGVGGLSAGILGYGKFLGKGTKEAITTKTSSAQVFSRLREEMKDDLGDKVWKSSIGKKITSSIPGGSKLAKVKSPFALGAIAGLAGWQALVSATSLLQGEPLTAIPGVALLGSSKTEEEVQRIYSGEEEVAIRKGRFWEMGRSPFEGKAIDYYRSHMIHRLKTRAYQKGIYRNEAERWEYDPLLNPIDAVFGSDDWKYHYEKKYQYERPAPLTVPMGADIPFIGPLVAATIGKLLKPQKLIRPDEWMTSQGPIAAEPNTSEEAPAYELGGLKPGAPVSPTADKSNIFNKMNYLRREAVGLPGFMEASINKAITGREEMFPMETEIGSMGKETGSEYWLWKHLNIGGGLLSSEGIRRFIPITPSNWETYNPLSNNLASWLPGDDFLNLKQGNPMNKLPEAEIRLPGPGFAALNPELEGVHPEQYPLAYRVKILGDVAMWSPEYQSALAQAKRSFDIMSPKEVDMVKTTEKQVKEKKKKREFSEYNVFSDHLTSERITVKKVIDPRHILTEEYGNALVELQGFDNVTDMQKAQAFAEDTLSGKTIKLTLPKNDAQRYSMSSVGPKIKAVAFVGGEEYGDIISGAGLAESKKLDDEFTAAKWSLGQKIAGGLSEGILHNIETPLDYLTPLAPASKLIHERSAIEEYVATQAVGTESSFWDRPVDNFIKPAINMLRYKASPGTSIPESTERKRAIQQYFDMLAWKKASMLEKAAKQSGDTSEARRWEEEKKRTVFGADVFGSPAEVMRALPRADRDFYSAFVNAKTEEDKEKILSLVPADQRRVYMGAWRQQAAQAARAKIEAGIASERESKIIEDYRKVKYSQGYDYDRDHLENYRKETGGSIPFDDYMREQIADQYFSKNALPDPSWLGFNAAVDIEDVKMMYVESAGMDYHDMDLWDTRKRAMARKPYINKNLISELTASSELNQASNFAYQAEQLPARYNSERHSVSTMIVEENIGRNRFDLQIEDKRYGLIEKAFDNILGGN